MNRSWASLSTVRPRFLLFPSVSFAQSLDNSLVLFSSAEKNTPDARAKLLSVFEGQRVPYEHSRSVVGSHSGIGPSFDSHGSAGIKVRSSWINADADRIGKHLYESIHLKYALVLRVFPLLSTSAFELSGAREA